MTKPSEVLDNRIQEVLEVYNQVLPQKYGNGSETSKKHIDKFNLEKQETMIGLSDHISDLKKAKRILASWNL